MWQRTRCWLFGRASEARSLLERSLFIERRLRSLVIGKSMGGGLAVAGQLVGAKELKPDTPISVSSRSAFQIRYCLLSFSQPQERMAQGGTGCRAELRVKLPRSLEIRHSCGRLLERHQAGAIQEVGAGRLRICLQDF